MDRDRKEEEQHRPDRATVEEGERNREKLDDIPPPGTDPLHEGP